MRSLPEALIALLKKPAPEKKCLVGFDGFVDEIVQPMASIDRPFASIQAFEERIETFAGTSGNIELQVKKKKLGGNGPILANALLEGGFPVAVVGALGKPEINPLFFELKQKGGTLFSYAAEGHSDCLEFPEGKIILGKMGGNSISTVEDLVREIPSFFDLLDEADLFVSVNWTMLPMMNKLWEEILNRQFSPKKRILFVDLADPAKRSDTDLKKAIELLVRFVPLFEVHLGLNTREAERVAQLHAVQPWDKNEPQTAFVQRLKEKIPLPEILFHNPHFAANASYCIPSLHIEKPLLSTGAGDNFNAGYLLGLLLGGTAEQALKLGVETASFYVRKGKSPTREELIHGDAGGDRLGPGISGSTVTEKRR